jgi:hypothetical protein
VGRGGQADKNTIPFGDFAAAKKRQMTIKSNILLQKHALIVSFQISALKALGHSEIARAYFFFGKETGRNLRPHQAGKIRELFLVEDRRKYFLSKND